MHRNACSRIKDPKIMVLIYNVRINPELYDYRLPGYHDDTLKYAIWEKIATKCNLPNAAEAIKCWKDLLHSFTVFYRNELIRLVRANSKEQDISAILEKTTSAEPFDDRPWNYYSDMRFVAPFRVKGLNPELDRLIELAKPIVCKDTKSSKAKSSSESNNAEATVSTKVDQELPSPNQIQQNLDPLLGMDVPKMQDGDLSPDDVCLWSFFDSLCRSTRVLPKHLQNRVKREMLLSLNKAEDEEENTS